MRRKKRIRPRSDKSERSREETAERAEDGETENPEDDARQSVRKNKDGSGVKRKKLDSAKEHKKTLALLKNQDPDFYKYLQDNDQSLLDFDLSDDEENQSALGESDDDKEEESSSDNEIDRQETTVDDDPGFHEQDDRPVITSQMVDRWSQASKGGVLGATKNLLRAFRSACHFGDGEESSNADEMVLGGNEVLNRVMLNTLSGMHATFAILLKENDSQEAKIPDHPSRCKRWRKVEPLARIYLGSTAHALAQMSEDAMVSFTFRALRRVCRIICVYEPRRYAVKMVRQASKIWASHSALRARLAAFLFLRDILISMNDSLHDDSVKEAFQEQVIKAMCKLFSSYAKFVKPSMLPFVRFCQNCVAEIVSLTPDVGYLNAFGGIRDLAVELRHALQSKDKNAFKAIYSWQYICKLELWERVLSQNSKNDSFLPLVYPLGQLLQAVIRISASAKLFPLRVRLMHAINDLSESTACYIPIAGFVQSILEYKGFSKTLDGSVNINSRPNSFGGVLRVPESALSTKAFQESAVSAALEVLAKNMCLWSSSISFPEMVFPITSKLRAFAKSCSVDRFRRRVKLLIQAIDENAAHIMQRRSTEALAPNDLVEIGLFQKRDMRKTNPLTEFYDDIKSRKADELVSQYIEDIKIPNDSAEREGANRESKSHGADAVGQRRPFHSLVPIDGLDEAQEFQEDVLEVIDFSDDDV